MNFKYFNRYLHFSKQQQIGVFILFAIMIGLQFFYLLSDFEVLDVKDSNKDNWLAYQSEIDREKLDDENKLEILLCSSVLGNANIFAKISDDLALKEHNIYQLLNVISNSKFNDVNKIGLFYDFIKSKYDIDFNNNTGSTIIIDMFKNNTAKLSSGIVDVLKRNNIDIFISDKDGKSAFDYMNVDIKAKAEQVYIVEIIDKEKKVLENIFNNKEDILNTKVRTNRL